MDYRLDFCCANGRFAVITDTMPKLIGHIYKFKPMKGRLIKPGYDEADFHYFREPKTPIPSGTQIQVDCWFMNFYGSYFRIKFNGSSYDVDTNSVVIEK